MRPPRVSVTTFTSYICCIYALKFGQYWTLFCIGNSSVSSTPYIQFLFVRPRFCLRLPSSSASQRTPLSLANSSYCQACSGLAPPSDYACRAHDNEKDISKEIMEIHDAIVNGIATYTLKYSVRTKKRLLGLLGIKIESE